MQPSGSISPAVQLAALSRGEDTALLHVPLCSGVAEISVDWEPVMRGLFLEL